MNGMPEGRRTLRHAFMPVDDQLTMVLPNALTYISLMSAEEYMQFSHLNISLI
jgi:hypothetical protein